MRLFAWLLIVASLVAALVAALTAYSPRLDDAKTYLAGASAATAGRTLTLNAPAGREVVDGRPRPVAVKDTPLTPELVERLIASGERRVRVKEFHFSMWREWWLFALGCAGMLAGALVVRREAAKRLVPATDEAAAAAPRVTPEAAVRELRAGIRELLDRLAQTSDRSAQIRLVIDRVDEMNAQLVAPFVAARPQLVARLGLAGYAQLMDRFAGGERQLNRSWSAAADGYEEHAVECLANASVLFEEAEQRIR